MTTLPRKPVAVRRAQDAETLRTEAVTVRLLIDSEEAGHGVSTVEVGMARGADGAAPHYHTRSDELFYVVEGELQVLAGDEIVTVGAGGALVVPKFMPHAFGAAPDSAARILIALMPGVQRFGYFRLLERVARGEATLADLGASQEEYDNHFVDAPRWWAERTTNRR
ncbi:cupin domain-containing protein [Nocardia terpenica]|uniref:cupin domain-containing protein n=1 Tax=Nocardia terpenica TaxID=455432 RepID=UPI0018949B55|nr:cupin domain-containing protein [Nocardia terpenica]MBF6059523.1 cupin domain-containing protein [Nocardia terpenica]MBF6102938.1 cupin domain-containing protein [Nocardia terpenica]MBF6110873.1 cupin domain-containing protein [Nocardia terpenica]MBF6117004.1 cupin domain-containing protein [Nocardia terpenica]MBF6151158.1 cupin domain-containing protein [Nocardia terpenica]